MMADPFGNELTSAAARGDLEQIEILLQNNANVNAKNEFGRTALQVMKLGNPGIAWRLLHGGADPNLKDRTGFAVIHDAARAGFLDTVQTLLQFRAEVNIEDNEGNLPLHLAAQEGHLSVVEFLVRHTESDMGHLNHKGATAHDLARLYKREKVVNWMDDNVRVQAANLQ